MTRRRLVRAGALLALLASAGLVAFAVDVLRWDARLAEQDVRFAAAPRQATYADPRGLLPLGAAQRALSAGDDLSFRRQLQSFARVRPGAAGDAIVFEQLHGETQLALARLSRVDPDLGRRSRAANMIGVLALDPERAAARQDEFSEIVQGAVDAFRSAVEIDPANADAKRNLELSLRISAAFVLPGDDPSGSRDAGEQAGLGRPGSGY